MNTDLTDETDENGFPIFATAYSRFYIQSALNIDTKEKRDQEIHSLTKVDDSFQKIVVVKDDIIPWTDESGIFYIGIQEFLLNYIDNRM